MSDAEAAGIYEVEEPMPYAPSELQKGPPHIIPLLERIERDEAAWRVLRFSRNANMWVGVRWEQLLLQMQEDWNTHMKAKKIIEQNAAEKNRTDKANVWRTVLGILTFGIFLLFTKHKKPTLIPVPSVPFSSIYLFEAQTVINGVHELLESGLLRRSRFGIGEDAIDVIYPTYELALIYKERVKSIN